MKNNVNKERGKSPTKVFLKKSKKGVDKAEESGYTEEAVARDGPRGRAGERQQGTLKTI